MADTNAKMTQATPQEVIVSIVAGLFAPLLAIFLIVQLVLSIQEKHIADTTSDAAIQATDARIRPVAKLEAIDANAPKVEMTGQQVFETVCTSCHTAGALGAPKFNNKGDWGPRIAQGYDTLVKHALEGIRSMPARGGNPDLSDTEVARAVAYMANAGGASFKEPAAPAAAAAPGDAAAAPAAAAKPDAAKGKAVVDANCAACHATGAAGAPKVGDKAAWGPRVATGFDALLNSALHGKNAMPAKGGNASLADADVADAVMYLYTEGGGK